MLRPNCTLGALDQPVSPVMEPIHLRPTALPVGVGYNSCTSYQVFPYDMKPISGLSIVAVIGFCSVLALHFSGFDTLGCFAVTGHVQAHGEGILSWHKISFVLSGNVECSSMRRCRQRQRQTS